MDRVDTVCTKLEALGTVEAHQRIEFDADGSVHVTAGWKRWISRKWPNRTGQSRKRTIQGIADLLELSNELSSGLMRKPKIRVNSPTVGVYDRANVVDSDNDDEADANDHDNEQSLTPPQELRFADKPTNINDTRSMFFDRCDERVRTALRRLSAALKLVCRALNTLAVSTYNDDPETGGSLMHLINFATLQHERVDDYVVNFSNEK